MARTTNAISFILFVLNDKGRPKEKCISFHKNCIVFFFFAGGNLQNYTGLTFLNSTDIAIPT